ncbi:MAG: hypothetical protein AAF989_11525 [Planctomycetota bacterium]
MSDINSEMDGIFGAVPEPTLIPSADLAGPVPTKPASVNWFLLVIVAATAFYLGSRSQGFQRDDGQSDDSVIVVDDEDQDREGDDEPSIDLNGARLVFVFERLNPTADARILMDWSRDELCPAKGMVHIELDDEQEPAAPLMGYAVGRGFAAPAMFLIKDKQILRGISMPKSQDEIKDFLK